MHRFSRLAIAVGASVVLATAACGRVQDDEIVDPPPRPLPSHVNGSRLRARIAQADGVQVFLGWMDTKLGVACRFEIAADDVLRCVPEGVVSLDYTCTERAAVAVPDRTKPTCDVQQETSAWAVSREYGSSPACGSGTLKTRALVYRPGVVDTTCEGTVPETTPHVAVPVDPKELVGAEIEIVSRTARVAARVAVAEDGARQIVGFYDRDRAAPCDVTPGGPKGTALCIPETARWAHRGNYFTVSCAPINEVAYAYGPCDVPDVVTTDGCEPALFSAGVPMSPSDVQRHESANGCDVVTEFSHPKSFWMLGPPLAEGVFAAMTKIEIGTKRIRMSVWADDAKVPFALAEPSGPYAYGDLVDSELGGPCADLANVNGSLRCIPSAVMPTQETQFIDPACTVPVVELRRPSRGVCAPPLEVTMALVTRDGCDNDLFALGDPYEGEAFAKRPNGACKSTGGTRLGGGPYFRLAERLPADRLAPVTIRQE